MNTSNESTNLWSLATDMDDDRSRLATGAETGASALVKRAVETCLGQVEPLDLQALLQSMKKNSEAPEEEKLWFGGDIYGQQRDGVFTRFFPLPDNSGFSDIPAVSRTFRLMRQAADPSRPTEDAVDQVKEVHYSHEAPRQVTGTISYDLHSDRHFELFSVTTRTSESLAIHLPYGGYKPTTLYTDSKGDQITELDRFPEDIRHRIQTFIDRENKRQGFAGDDR